MPLESYPLPSPTPDPAEAARLLALTQTALEGPIAALSDAAGGGLTQTSGQLQAIQRRLLSSAQARLKGTGRDVGLVADKLHAGAQAALAETAASVAMTAQRAGRTGQVVTPTSVFWASVRCPDLAGQVIPAERGSPPDPGAGWRIFGPYATFPEASGAVEIYKRYLAVDASCTGAPAGGGGGPAAGLDWYWVD